MGKLLDEIQTRISEAAQQPDVKTREVFLDLTALRQEFEDLRFDAKAKTFRVFQNESNWKT